MKFSFAAIMGLLVAEQGVAFLPQAPLAHRTFQSRQYMGMDTPPPAQEATNLPVVQASQYGPTDVRYSDFLRLVNADRIEKVTFSSDGSQLLGVDVDGARVKIEALPNDPGLLTQLTSHKVSRT